MSSTKILTIAALRQYLRDMIMTGRPGDGYPRINHAMNIDQETVFAVLGNLIMRADDGSIEIGERLGKQINQLWFTVQGRPYWLGYNAPSIEIRPRNRGGATAHMIDKATAPTQISAIFAAL